jgi:hypothetical protein
MAFRKTFNLFIGQLSICTKAVDFVLKARIKELDKDGLEGGDILVVPQARNHIHQLVLRWREPYESFVSSFLQNCTSHFTSFPLFL